MTEYTDADCEKAVRLAALHYRDLDQEWQAWLVKAVVDCGVRDIGPANAVELLTTLADWAQRTREGQALLEAEQAR